MSISCVGTGGSNFSQSGQVDWVSLGQTSFSASIAILGRLEGAGVAALTVAVGTAICSTLRLSSDGENRLDHAFKSLHSTPSLGKVLWFGLGIKHVAAALAETRQGSSCVALCSALAEIYDPTFSAMVLDELTKEFNGPDELCPSIRQWRSLVESCSRLFAKSSFSQFAHHFMSLARSRMPRPTTSMPRDLARAIQALGLVAIGQLESIFIRGNECAGWLAAYAHFLLGLSIEIQDCEGKILFQSTRIEKFGNDKSATSKQTRPRTQVTIIFSETSRSDAAVEMLGSTYILTDASNFLKTSLGFEEDVKYLDLKVPWSEAVVSVFGATGVELLDIPELGLAIGFAAKILQGINMYHPLFRQYRNRASQWFLFNSLFDHEGFLDKAVVSLPELLPLKAHMTKASSFDFAEVSDEYSRVMEHIESMCQCGCKFRHHERRITLDSPRPDICLATLSRTIIKIAWNTSFFQVDSKIMASRHGLKEFYLMEKQREDNYNYNSSDHFIRLLKYGPGKVDSGFTFSHPLPIAVLLYTGKLPPKDSRETGWFSAIAQSGLCFFYDVLCELTTDAGTVNRVSIEPGLIQSRKGRNYQMIRDDASEQLSYDNYSVPGVQISSLQLAAVSDSTIPGMEVNFVMSEVLHGLFVELQIISPKGYGRIAPCSLIESILSGSGKVYCDGRTCSGPNLFPLVFELRGEGPLGQKPTRPTIYLRRLYVLGRILALIVKDTNRTIYFQRRECVGCCIKEANDRMELLGKRRIDIFLRDYLEDEKVRLITEGS